MKHLFTILLGVTVTISQLNGGLSITKEMDNKTPIGEINTRYVNHDRQTIIDNFKKNYRVSPYSKVQPRQRFTIRENCRNCRNKAYTGTIY